MSGQEILSNKKHQTIQNHPTQTRMKCNGWIVSVCVLGLCQRKQNAISNRVVKNWLIFWLLPLKKHNLMALSQSEKKRENCPQNNELQCASLSLTKKDKQNSSLTAMHACCLSQHHHEEQSSLHFNKISQL